MKSKLNQRLKKIKFKKRNMTNNLKLEKLKTLFNCKFCAKVLVKPIALSCGITICESHLDELLNDKCQFCEQQHSKGPYKVNEAFSQMLELQVNTIKMSPKFDACKRSIDKAAEFVNKIDLVSKDPENFIYEYFEEIKQKVDVQREELKLKIDDYSNEIIGQIDQTKTDCIKMAKEINQITTDIENLRTDLNNLVQRFDSFEFNDEKYEDINSRVDILQPKFEDILDEYKYLLLGGKDYEFRAKDKSMENVFGTFMNNPGGKVNKHFLYSY